jgi:hypothetical protein
VRGSDCVAFGGRLNRPDNFVAKIDKLVNYLGGYERIGAFDEYFRLLGGDASML